MMNIKTIKRDAKNILSLSENPPPVCPIRDILDKISGKWSLLVLLTLSVNGKKRFNQLKRELGDISQRMLTVTLRSLERDGLVTREIFSEIPPRVEYELTDLGYSSLEPMLPLIRRSFENLEVILKSRAAFDRKNKNS